MRPQIRQVSFWRLAKADFAGSELCSGQELRQSLFPPGWPIREFTGKKVSIQMESELGGLSCSGSKVKDQCLAVQVSMEESGRLQRLAILQRQERFEFTISFEEIGPQRRATLSGNTQRLQV